jgi:hypothetical protein
MDSKAITHNTLGRQRQCDLNCDFCLRPSHSRSRAPFAWCVSRPEAPLAGFASRFIGTFLRALCV